MELYHHGVKGQKWGVRRYQNADGSLTPRGKKRELKKLNKQLNKQEFNAARSYGKMSIAVDEYNHYASKYQEYSKGNKKSQIKKAQKYLDKATKMQEEVGVAVAKYEADKKLRDDTRRYVETNFDCVLQYTHRGIDAGVSNADGTTHHVEYAKTKIRTNTNKKYKNKVDPDKYRVTKIWYVPVNTF